jgi:hypothetical protein
MLHARFLAFAGLFLLAVGCSVESASDEPTVEDEGESDAQDQDLVRRHHYAPRNAELFWLPGCGQQPPDGHICQMGLFLRYTKRYIDLSVTQTSTVSPDGRKLTIKIDTWSTSARHPLVLPSPITEPFGGAGPGPGLQMRFDAKIVDWRNRELWSGPIVMMPAP